MTGVVNILLDKDLEGLKVDLDFGSSDGDGDNYHIGIAGGTELSAAAATSWPARSTRDRIRF